MATKTIADVAAQIAEAVMDAIEKRQGIVKDDLTEAARGVLAKNQGGASPYNPYLTMAFAPCITTRSLSNGTAKG